MRRLVLLLAFGALGVLLACGAAYAQEADTTPPETTLDQRPEPFSAAVSPRISFSSDDSAATFECQLDGGPYSACSSPKQLFLLSEGQHTFSVRAVDAASNTDPTPATHAWTVDSFDPKVTFTEKPGEVTNDRSPTWAWTARDPNRWPEEDYCSLYDDTNNRTIFSSFDGCASPLAFGADLPDGNYYWELGVYDKAYNSSYHYLPFEVDTVAPKVASVAPTGTLVSRYSNPVVRFDDKVYGSAEHVNIYERGTTTPLAVERNAYNKVVKIFPKRSLKPATWYTVKVTTGVTDGANRLAKPRTWSFRTK